MKEGLAITAAPAKKTMTRQQTIQEEHKDALERAVSLNVPHAVTSSEEAVADAGAIVQSKPEGRINWEELAQRLFDKDEAGKLVLKKDVAVAE
uniref:Uncharacterized protein n=5 Tax=Nymphaea colorata TaxID=210225 RepID=A0A5K1FXW2_9MAGN